MSHKMETKLHLKNVVQYNHHIVYVPFHPLYYISTFSKVSQHGPISLSTVQNWMPVSVKKLGRDAHQVENVRVIPHGGDTEMVNLSSEMIRPRFEMIRLRWFRRRSELW